MVWMTEWISLTLYDFFFPPGSGGSAVSHQAWLPGPGCLRWARTRTLWHLLGKLHQHPLLHTHLSLHSPHHWGLPGMHRGSRVSHAWLGVHPGAMAHVHKVLGPSDRLVVRERHAGSNSRYLSLLLSIYSVVRDILIFALLDLVSCRPWEDL